MKKFFEKHDLFKMAVIVLLLAVVFSWIMPYTFYNGDSFDSSQGISRIGIFDLSTYISIISQHSLFYCLLLEVSIDSLVIFLLIKK